MRCARTRHRAIVEQFRNGFSGFGDVGIACFCDFGGSWHHFGGPGPILRIFVIILIFGRLPARITTSILSPKWSQQHTFSSLMFSMFSGALASLFFVILSALRLHFNSILAPFWEPWAFEKTAKSV